jgi:PAS domain S-box-containing protein
MTPSTEPTPPPPPSAAPGGLSLGDVLGRIADVAEDVILVSEVEPLDEPGPRIVYVNPAFTRMTGYTSEEVLGRTPRLLQGPGTCPEACARIRAALQQWQPIRIELLNYRKDGSEFWVELSITPVADDTGWFRYWVAVQRETTAAKLREREMVAAQRLKAVGEMTGGIAHDFNNLLTAISGAAELLAARVGHDAESTKLVDAIRAAAHGGTSQVRRLMSFSRTPLLARGPVNLHTVLEQLGLLLRRSLRDNITLEISHHPQARWVDAEAVQLEASLLNLVLNAQDAIGHAGRIAIGYRPLVRDGQDCVCLEVSDTGSGMDDATLARIFEPFFTTKDAGRGSGLGLAMVKSFITQLGGEVAVRSQSGHGTTFSLILPGALPALPVASAPGTSAAGRACRVLLVEDDEVVRMTTAAMLESLGHAVHECENADEALEVLDSSATFDVLFTDLLMPGSMGGHALAALSRRRWPAMRIIMASGWADSDLPELTRPDSSTPFVLKPYTRDDLAQAFARVLGPPPGG